MDAIEQTLRRRVEFFQAEVDELIAAAAIGPEEIGKTPRSQKIVELEEEIAKTNRQIKRLATL